MLNQFVSIAQDEYKDAPARLSMNLLRRNYAGVVWVNKAVAKQKLSVAAEWKALDMARAMFNFSLGTREICNGARWTTP